jgi:hypothetical protein
MPNHFIPSTQHKPLQNPEHFQVQFLGMDVQIFRNDDTGQLGVHINTEAVRDYDHHDGMPKISISLNDGDVYHDEGQGDEVAKQHGIDAIEAEKRQFVPTNDKAGNI